MAATKPAWATGAKAAIALRKPAAAAAQQQAASGGAKAATWSLAVDGDEDEELVDDEALLTAEDKQRPAPAAGALARLEREGAIEGACTAGGQPRVWAPPPAAL